MAAILASAWPPAVSAARARPRRCRIDGCGVRRHRRCADGVTDLARAALAPSAAVGAGVAGVAYAALVERTWFPLRRFEVPVLPPGARPLRVLHLSRPAPDARASARKTAWVRSLAELEPDLVIDTGDNLAHLDAVPAVLDALGPLLERPGAFVIGSNDYYAPMLKNPRALPARRHAEVRGTPGPTCRWTGSSTGLRAGGWVDLTTPGPGCGRSTTGPRAGRHRRPAHRADRYAEVAGAGGPRRDLSLGVTHAPYLRVLDAMVADGASAGARRAHPRRPAVRCPGYGALVTNCDLTPAAPRGCPRWWPGPAHRTAAVPRRRRRPADPRGCTSRPGWAPRRTRRSGSPAARGDPADAGRPRA